MSKPPEDIRRENTWMALALASVAGFVDAVGYMVLQELFTAHMRGNTARLGVFLGHGDVSAAIPLAAAILLFIFGIALGATVSELATRQGIQSTAAIVLGLQAALLAVFMTYGSMVVRHGSVSDHSLGGFYVLAALAIVSMGLQACTLQQIAGRTVLTTYVSGVLTALAQEGVNYLFWLRDGDRREKTSYLGGVVGLGSRQESLGRVVILGGVWCLYLVGAVWGSYAEGLWRLRSFVFPLGVLAIAIVADLRRPINAVEQAGGRSEAR